MKTGKQLLIALAFVVPALFTVIACNKENNIPEETEEIQPLPRPIGTPTGSKVTKQIGAAGGSLTSADQKITITIPAGAVNANTLFGIEPITNTNIAGIGTAYRLTPHGTHFDKPIAITFSWASHADSIGLLQTLGLAYQGADGTWRFMGAGSIDENAKTITYEATHFSDWSVMNRVSLFPYHAEVEPRKTQTIAAFLYTRVKDDELFATIPPVPGAPPDPGYPVGDPIPLPSKYIKKWHLAGPGTITAKAPSVVEYQAPFSVNDADVTAAVSLELKAPARYPGQYLLVSNITIKGSFIKLSVGGGPQVTFPASPAVKNGNQYLVANPSNEGGGYFLLTWTDGHGVHPYDLSNNGTYTHFITPQASYISRYRLDPTSDLLPSGGQVLVTNVSDGWVEGTFMASNAGYGPTLTSTTTLEGRFKVRLAP